MKSNEPKLSEEETTRRSADDFFDLTELESEDFGTDEVVDDAEVLEEPLDREGTDGLETVELSSMAPDPLVITKPATRSRPSSGEGSAEAEQLSKNESKSSGLVYTRSPRVKKLALFWLVMLLLPLALGAGMYSWFSSTPELWQARAEIQYRGSAWTETQDIAIRSRSLTAPIATEFGVPIGELESNLDAGLITGSQVIRLDYKDTDRDRAVKIVDALAKSYIAQTSEVTPEGVFERLEAQREEVVKALEEAKVRQAEIPAGGSSKLISDRAAIASEIDALEDRLTVIESKILDTNIQDLDRNANGVPILLTEAFAFDSPVAPKPLRWAAAGFMLGALVSVALSVFLLSRLAKQSKTWMGRTAVQLSTEAGSVPVSGATRSENSDRPAGGLKH